MKDKKLNCIQLILMRIILGKNWTDYACGPVFLEMAEDYARKCAELDRRCEELERDK